MTKLYLAFCCIFLLSISIASADYVSLDNWTFDLQNGGYITIPYLFNASRRVFFNIFLTKSLYA
jgi:hypothetical protein